MKYPEAKWAEKVTERLGDHVIQSQLVPIGSADDSCKNPCGHIGIWDESGWLYDFRCCAVCGTGLGAI